MAVRDGGQLEDGKEADSVSESSTGSDEEAPPHTHTLPICTGYFSRSLCRRLSQITGWGWC